MTTPDQPDGPPRPGDQPNGPQSWVPPQQPWGAQPGSPAAAGQPWSGQQAFGQLDPQKAGPRTWLAIGGAVLVGAVLIGGLVSGVGGGAPEIGDCVKAEGTTYETVDCDSDDAQFRVVGTDEDMTESEFDADRDTCAAVAARSDAGSGVALWSGSVGGVGQVFCAEAV